MWTYVQRTGELLNDRGEHAAFGYAGKGEGKNNPEMQHVHNVGPLPAGIYTITAPVDTRTHGPYVLWLTPAPSNYMCNRSAFGIHGDNITNPGTASEGCIILAKLWRHQIWESGDHTLRVCADKPSFN